MSSERNELYRIWERYFSSDNIVVHYYGSGGRIREVLDCLYSLTPFDHPDAYYSTDNEFIVFEHFEFDSSKGNRKKGSQQRRSEADDTRAFNAVIPTKEGSEYHGCINASYCIDYYKDNLMRSFSEHYKEIPEYKKTLSKIGLLSSSKRVTTIFFIEDSALLGNTFDSGEWDKPSIPLILLHCDFFLDLFENSPELDCVIFGRFYDRELWYIDHSLIDTYREHEVDTSNIQLFNYNPRSTGFKVLLSPDEIE